MYWQEATEKIVVPDDIIDLSFKIKCPMVPLDHAFALSDAIEKALPWFKDEEHAGLHLIHGAASGNGWFRPEDAETELLQLSHRASMAIRIPKQRLDDANELIDQTIDVAGYALTFGKSRIKPLTSMGTIFSRYVVCDPDSSEEDFQNEFAQALDKMDIEISKMLCGLTHRFDSPDGPVYTRMVMLAELTPKESVRLQQNGIGPGRKTGFGLFIPHKGIAAVKKESGDED